MKMHRRHFCRSLLAAGAGGFIPFAYISADTFRSGDAKLSDNKIVKNNNSESGYVKLHRTGELRKRADVLWDMMGKCRICPRDCGANRLKNQKGDCNATSELEVSSFSPHFGEEPPLVGRNGSGTVFFTNCSLLCVFCINWEISQGGMGQTRTVKELANMMLLLQRMGCHNINVVSPTHYIPHIMFALDEAVPAGLRIPLVYNTSGWEKIEILQLLDGVVDIYLTDFKYFDSEMSDKYSPGASSYPEVTKKAILEMHRQVGVADATPDKGIMSRGLIIRHLIMPNNVSGTSNVINWVAENLPGDTYINIMSQYTPVYKANQYPQISRRITRSEYNRALRAARNAGLVNIDAQPM